MKMIFNGICFSGIPKHFLMLSSTLFCGCAPHQQAPSPKSVTLIEALMTKVTRFLDTV